MGTNSEIADDQPVILFDGVCNLCNASVNFIIDRDSQGLFRFASLQSDFGKKELKRIGTDSSQLSSIVLLSDGEVFTKSTAALKIAKDLSGAISSMHVFLWVPSVIRDYFYDFIARNRYRWFGKTDACRLPTAGMKKRFVA